MCSGGAVIIFFKPLGTYVWFSLLEMLLCAKIWDDLWDPKVFLLSSTRICTRDLPCRSIAALFYEKPDDCRLFSRGISLIFWLLFRKSLCLKFGNSWVSAMVEEPIGALYFLKTVAWSCIKSYVIFASLTYSWSGISNLYFVLLKSGTLIRWFSLALSLTSAIFKVFRPVLESMLSTASFTDTVPPSKYSPPATPIFELMSYTIDFFFICAKDLNYLNSFCWVVRRWGIRFFLSGCSKGLSVIASRPYLPTSAIYIFWPLIERGLRSSF